VGESSLIQKIGGGKKKEACSLPRKRPCLNTTHLKYPATVIAVHNIEPACDRTLFIFFCRKVGKKSTRWPYLTSRRVTSDFILATPLCLVFNCIQGRKKQIRTIKTKLNVTRRLSMSRSECTFEYQEQSHLTPESKTGWIMTGA
jgi:hypothetical protein